MLCVLHIRNGQLSVLEVANWLDIVLDNVGICLISSLGVDRG